MNYFRIVLLYKCMVTNTYHSFILVTIAVVTTKKEYKHLVKTLHLIWLCYEHLSVVSFLQQELVTSIS